MAETITHLIAKLSGDATDLFSKLNEAITRLEKVEDSSIRTEQVINRAFHEATKGPKEFARELDQLEKAEAHQAEYEYRLGKKSVEDYKSFLSQRMNAFSAYTVEWKTSAAQITAIEKEESTKRITNYKAEAELKSAIIRANLAATGASASAFRDHKTDTATKILFNTSGMYDIKEQIAAAEKLVLINKERVAEEVRLEQEGVTQRETALANLARFEYEQGTLSYEAYKVFLERRMQAYGQYTAEWKSASFQLLSIEREHLSERERLLRGFESERVTIEKRTNDALAVIDKTRTAFLADEEAKRFANMKTNQEAAILAGEKFNAARVATFGTVGHGLGNVAAGVTAVEIASGIMSTKFNHELLTTANNTIMTTDRIAEMRKEVLELSKTGSNTPDLLAGYRWISDYKSGTFTSKQTNEMLEWANKEAIPTGSNPETVARALAMTMSAFHEDPSKSANYMDLLHHAAATSATTVEELSASAGPAIAIMASMKMKAYETYATIGALTQGGFNASEAVTQVKGLISHIANPADKSTKMLTKLQDITGEPLLEMFSQKGLEKYGMMGILEGLARATGGRADLLAETVPAMRGGIGLMALTQESMRPNSLYVKNMKDMKALQYATTNQGSETQGIFDRMKDDPQQKLKVLSNTIQTDFIPVGEKAVKIFEAWEPTIVKVVNAILKLTETFQKLPMWAQEVIVLAGAFNILGKATGLFTALKVPLALTTWIKEIGGITKVPTGVITWLKDLVGITPKLGTFTTTVSGMTSTVSRLGPAFLVAEEGSVALGTAISGPLVLGIAAGVLAVGGLGYALYKYLNHEEDVKKALKESAVEHVNTATKSAEHAHKLADLTKEYENLRDKLPKTTENTQKMHDVLNKISVLAPDWITEYDKTGNAIALIGSKSATSATQAARLADRLKDLAKIDLLNLQLGEVNKKIELDKSVNSGTYGINPETHQMTIRNLSNVGKMVNGVLVPFTQEENEAKLRADLATKADLEKRIADLSLQHTGRGLPSGGPLGLGMAKLADSINIFDKEYEGNCEHLGNTIRHGVTHIFDKYHGASARLTALNLIHAGLMQPYVAGEDVAPGTQLFSMTLAKHRKHKDGQYYDDGHVVTTDLTGHRVDQHGESSNIGLANYQWQFNPDYAAAILKKRKELGEADPSSQKKGTSFTGVTDEQLAAYDAKMKAQKEAAAAHKTALKTANAEYDRELISVKRIIALQETGANKKKEDLDVFENREKAIFDLSKDGQLALITDASKRRKLITAATLADDAEHVKFLSDVLDKVRDKEKVLTFPLNKQKAIDMMGGWDSWQLMGKEHPEFQTKALQLVDEQEINKEKKAVDDLNLSIAAIGNPAKQKAIQDVAQGSAEIWKKTPLAVKEHAIEAAKVYLIAENLSKLKMEWIDKANSALPQVKTNAEAAEREIDKLKTTLGFNEFTANKDQANTLLGIRTDAHKKDVEETTNWLHDQRDKLDLQQKDIESKQRENKWVPIDVGAEAVNKWKAANSAEVNKFTIVNAENTTQYAEYVANLSKISSDAITNDSKLQTEALNDTIEQGKIGLQDLFYSMDSVYQNGTTAVTLWEHTNRKAIAQLRQDMGAAAEDIITYDEKIISQLAESNTFITMMKEGIQGLAQAGMSGLHNAFFTDPSKIGSAQSTLLSQKNEQMQLMIAERQWQNQYPGDPNDPYIRRLKDIQKEIDNTTHKLHGMGSSLVSTFSRLFSGIYNSFKETLLKMAESYLQSQLVQYLTKQMGTGAGMQTGGSNNSGGTLGFFQNIIGMGLQFLAPGIGGAGAGIGGISGGGIGGVASGGIGGFGVIPAFASGGRYSGRHPMWVGDGGEPELIVPDLPGTVYPMSKIKMNGSSSGEGDTIVNNNYNNFNQTVNTPDVQGMRSSRATQRQEAVRFFSGRRAI